MKENFETVQSIVDRGLQQLGIRNFLFGIHDAAFPSLPEEDIGRGSPYSVGAVLFDVVMKSARSNCRNACGIACEIMSTQPYPIQRVMERYGLGRFRVTQKADLDNPHDVYRSENARPEDWLMLGNHDTPSIWQMAERWIRSGTAEKQAAYLADRLRIAEKERCLWIKRTAADAGMLAQAKFADLFVGPGKNIMVFFTDLLAIGEAYNKPGSVSEDNWSLRIDPAYQNRFHSHTARSRALDVPGALSVALRARGFAPAIFVKR